MLKIKFIITIFIFILIENSISDCSNYGCLGTLKCDGTKNEIFTPNKTLNNCCPMCVQYSVVDESCGNSVPCAPGLKCSNSKCVPSDDELGICQSFPYRPEIESSDPACDYQGYYQPVQCKGDELTGRCFCYSKEGKRIFGQQWWSENKNMTCACSRKIEELKLETGRNDITIHCDQQGNFDELQCDDGVCWCADVFTGDAIAEVVPEQLMTLLPCYNSTIVGMSYSRKCDSYLTALNKIRYEMRSHGTMQDSFSAVRCGFDGSYAPYQYKGNKISCNWRDNSELVSGVPDTGEIICNCEWDKKYFTVENHEFIMSCQDGKYNKLQNIGEDEKICVDSDGYKYRNADYNATSDEYRCNIDYPTPVKIIS